MRARYLVALGVPVALVVPLGVAAATNVELAATHVYSQNMHPLGDSPLPNPAPGVFNSDLAFRGDRAYQGTYDGFRIVDISAPANPKTVKRLRRVLREPGRRDHLEQDPDSLVELARTRRRHV